MSFCIICVVFQKYVYCSVKCKFYAFLMNVEHFSIVDYTTDRMERRVQNNRRRICAQDGGAAKMLQIPKGWIQSDE